MKDSNSYSLLIPFVDGSESFTLGWECGQIYQSILDNGGYYGLAHVKNTMQIRGIVKALKCYVTFIEVKDMEDEWMTIEIKKLKVVNGG